MSLPAYCKITGEIQGLITEGALTEASVGQGWQENHKDEILVQSFAQEVTVAHDAYAAGAAGGRTNRAVHITKEIDKCSPRLHEALARNERLTNVEFTFFRVNASGLQELFFKITLEDARISMLRDRLAEGDDPGSVRFPMVEDVEIVFRKITREHMLGSTVSTDEWLDLE
jgi:type VI secretion system secreted protein Hcp